jgi:hypothetical protein
MPGYGIHRHAAGLKPWSWAEKRLKQAHNYWIATVHPDGRPNSSAVWGLWLEGQFWFSCATNSRKARNLARNPACTITTERADEAVIVEGVASPVSGRDKLAPFVRAYKRKYDWPMDPDAEGYFVVTPRLAFAFIEHADQFQKTSTRYDFNVPRRVGNKAPSR